MFEYVSIRLSARPVTEPSRGPSGRHPRRRFLFAYRRGLLRNESVDPAERCAPRGFYSPIGETCYGTNIRSGVGRTGMFLFAYRRDLLRNQCSNTAARWETGFLFAYRRDLLRNAAPSRPTLGAGSFLFAYRRDLLRNDDRVVAILGSCHVSIRLSARPVTEPPTLPRGLGSQSVSIRLSARPVTERSEPTYDRAYSAVFLFAYRRDLLRNTAYLSSKHKFRSVSIRLSARPVTELVTFDPLPGSRVSFYSPIGETCYGTAPMTSMARRERGFYSPIGETCYGTLPHREAL